MHQRLVHTVLPTSLRYVCTICASSCRWIAALVPLLITPGGLAYFDVTPKIAILLLGAALILLYPAENLRNVSAIARQPSAAAGSSCFSAIRMAFKRPRVRTLPRTRRCH